MFKKVFAVILSLFMVLTLFVPSGGILEVKANDAEIAAIVPTIPKKITKATYIQATCGTTTANVPVSINLYYIKTNSSSGTTYNVLSADQNVSGSTSGAIE